MAKLWGTVFEAILYGLYIACYGVCVAAFSSRSIPRTTQNKVILAIITVMFCICTAHLACSMRMLGEGLFNSHLASPDAYFNNRALPLNLATKSINAVVMLLGDGLMVYRLWVIYQRNIFIILLPITTMLGSGVILFLLVWEFSKLAPGQTAFAHTIKISAPSAFVLPLATNIIITTLILYRILDARREVRKVIPDFDDEFYRTVIANIVESCIAYPVALFVSLVLYLCDSNGQDVLTGPLTQIVSIVATLLWVHVGVGSSRYDRATGSRPATSDRSTHLAFACGSNGQQGRSRAHELTFESVPHTTSSFSHSTPIASVQKV